MLSEILRSRWFSGCVHAALWLLLLLVFTDIGGKRPQFRERPDPAAAVAPVPVAKLEIAPVPVAKLENLFAPVGQRKPVVDAGSRNPFDTTYFIPQTAPPPPSPTTRIIALTYQGFYQTGDSPKRAFIRFNDALASVPVGGSVATNLFVASATATNLTLTNRAIAGQSNVLVLNTKKEIEIPIK
jgi:hypothetical protein